VHKIAEVRLIDEEKNEIIANGDGDAESTDGYRGAHDEDGETPVLPPDLKLAPLLLSFGRVHCRSRFASMGLFELVLVVFVLVVVRAGPENVVNDGDQQTEDTAATA